MRFVSGSSWSGDVWCRGWIPSPIPRLSAPPDSLRPMGTAGTAAVSRPFSAPPSSSNRRDRGPAAFPRGVPGSAVLRFSVRMLPRMFLLRILECQFGGKFIFLLAV